MEALPRLNRQVSLVLPVVVLVLAFTAVPTELRLPNRFIVRSVLNPRYAPFDIAANILGYLPVGAVLAAAGPGPMLWTATGMSLFAEGTQVFSLGRAPSMVDVATNVLGAVLGWAMFRWWRVRPRPIAMNRRRAGLAALLAVAYLILGGTITPSDIEDTTASFLIAPPWLPVNERGATLPGTLEGHWTFDALDQNRAFDASPNGLTGVAANRPPLVTGIAGQAIDLDGRRHSVDVGDPIALRLTGSMTISAWIRPRDYLDDDNVIVSSFNTVGRGFQLDVTTDQGPPAIGFKLSDQTGQRMARYGRTTLRRNNWYHVAGVYDAQALTLDVYLNGHRDNGCLQGRITSRQRVSGMNTYIGARGRPRRERFAGVIDELKIYSRALTPSELAADLESVDRSSLALPAEVSTSEVCAPDRVLDSRVAGFTVGFGMLVAAACVGLWPAAAYRSAALGLSFLAGVVLLFSIGPVMPPLFRWLLPLLTLGGGSAVAVSARP